MADQNPTCVGAGSSDLTPPAREDAIAESAVLGFVLEAHPDHLTLPELSLAVYPRSAGEFSGEDTVARAIDALIGAGLLRLAGGLAVPTRAALYFNRLEVG